MRTSRARRSGPSRGKDTAWYREQVTRNVDPPADTEMRLRYAERQVEQLRKGCINALARDQRVGTNQRTTHRAFRSWEERLAHHLTTHHEITIEVRRSDGFTSYHHDGEYVGPWQMDTLHEQAHNRTNY